MLKGRHRSPVGFAAEEAPYYSGYRNLTRGGRYRRNPPHRSQPPPPPPPSRDDILLEAGRLAAYYLVSQGLLPASSLPTRWPHKARERDNSLRMPVPASRARVRRVGGYNYRGSNRDWIGDSPRNLGGDDHDQDEDSTFVATNSLDARGMSCNPSSLASPKLDVDLDDADNYNGGGDGGGSVKASLSSRDKEENETETESSGGILGKVDDLDAPRNFSTESVAMEKKDDDMEVEFGLQRSELPPDGPCEDLLSLCRYAKFQKRPRSLLPKRGAKRHKQEVITEKLKTNEEALTVEIQMDQPSMAEEEVVASEPPGTGWEDVDKTSGTAKPEIENKVVDDDSSDDENAPCTSAITPLSHVREPEIPAPDIEVEKSKPPIVVSAFPKSTPVQHASELVTEAAFVSIKSNLSRDNLTPACSHVDLSQGFSVPRTSGETTNAVLDAGGGGGVGGGFVQQGGTNKRSRKWYSQMVQQEDVCIDPCNLSARPFLLQGGKLIPDVAVRGEVTTHEKLNITGVSQRAEADPHMTFVEQNIQLHNSNSFKICDLNLMGSPEISEVPADNLIKKCIPDTIATLQTGNITPMKFGLLIGKDAERNDNYVESSQHKKVVRMIDLENDSLVDSGACGTTSKPRNEAMYGNLDCFLPNPESAVLSDIHDGYNNAITELLGSDITSCPAVAADDNGLQTGISLNGAEVIAGVDDSIYETLGGISIDFMEDIWGAPPQEYGKYF